MLLLVIGLVCSHILFLSGFYGLFFRRDNLIITIVSLEISLLGVALLFALVGLMLNDIIGVIMFLMMITLAGVESALGLALVIGYYRLKTSIKWSALSALRG